MTSSPVLRPGLPDSQSQRLPEREPRPEVNSPQAIPLSPRVKDLGSDPVKDFRLQEPLELNPSEILVSNRLASEDIKTIVDSGARLLRPEGAEFALPLHPNDAIKL